MNLLEKSLLVNSIKAYNLDNRISKLELVLRGISNKFGQRISETKGHSSVIIDRKHYNYGDQVKDIDWKLTAKTDKLYTKVRESYKQSRIYLIVDNSNSMKIKYNKQNSKLDFTLLLVYIIAFICLKEKDEVYIFYDKDFERVKSINELLNILIKLELNNSSSIFTQSLSIKKGYLYFFSDYFENIDIVSKFYSKISSLNVITGVVKDKVEEYFNFEGINNFLDPENKKNFILTNIKYIKTNYLNDYKKHYNLINQEFKKLNLKFFEFYSQHDPVSEFIRVRI